MSRSRKRCSMCMVARLGCDASLKRDGVSAIESGHPASKQMAARRGRLGKLTADEECDLHPPPTPPETQGNA